METTQSIEIDEIDNRYEKYRMREAKTEARLLIAIAECGILKPLQGADSKGQKILLDGFKRLRCAQKLNLQIVPYLSIGESESTGILELIRRSEAKSLDIFEQIKFIAMLKSEWGMSIPEIAEELNKSTGWVGMRVGVMKDISPAVVDKIMSGSFSSYAYMYYVKPFMRMKGVTKENISRFVSALAGKQLSTRQVEQLANAYFSGSPKVRQQIEEGNLNWGLKQLNSNITNKVEEYTPAEHQILQHLESVRKGMKQLVTIDCSFQSKPPAFRVQVHLIIEGILQKMEHFSQKINGFYDQTRHEKSDL